MLLYYIQVNLQFAAKINMGVLHEAVEALHEAVEALHETVEVRQEERQRQLAQKPITPLDIVLHYSAALK